MLRARALIRVMLCAAAVAATVLAPPSLSASPPGAAPGAAAPARPHGPKFPFRRPRQVANARVVLNGVPDDLIPGYDNSWACPCDSDGCWPGCFTVASASVLEYWSAKGYPNLWSGDPNGILARLRDLFGPQNLLCYGNGDGNGKPGDSGYDIFDVAAGLRQHISEQRYAFTLTPIGEPTFEQVMDEIDAGRPVIGAFGESPWGSHAGTIIGYDTTGGRKIMIVRPNLWQKVDTDLEWGVGYRGFSILTVAPQGEQPASTAVAPQITFETAVDDHEAGFAAVGAWQSLPGVGHGGGAKWALSTDPTNLGPLDDTAVARWSPELPFDGMWEAMAWMPVADEDDTTAHLVTYRIKHAEGMNLVRRSQKDAVQGWISLGMFPFVKGGAGAVYLGNLTGDSQPRKVWADSMRFVWRAPLLVRPEEDDAQLFLVMDGLRRRIPDAETFAALRLNAAAVRKLAPLPLAQYPPGDALPSIFGNWVGQYFDNSVLAPPLAAVQLDPVVSFRWNKAAPDASNPPAGFSARWTRVVALSEGVYPFAVEAVGGVRLWLDGQLRIDAWDAEGILIRHQQEISVTAGLHRLEIEYVSRGSNARLAFANLPPNVPVVDDPGTVAWTDAPTVTLRWRDGGDADASDKPRRFMARVWMEGSGWSAGSGWITATEWTAALPYDGRYQWRVSASDGPNASAWSEPRAILIDRSPPWAQMVAADARAESAPAPAAPAVPVDAPAAAAIKTVVDAAPVPDAGLAADEAADEAAGASIQAAAPIGTPASPAPVARALAGLRLTWWATDATSGAERFDVQARELIRASTIYSPLVVMTETTRIAYELIVSGSEEITRPMVIPVQVPITVSVPVMIYTPLTVTEWITFAAGVANTETVFLGTPGSTYEFRVRAVDRAGNAQKWHDGYSVQAQVDPRPALHTRFIPLLIR